MDLGTTLVADAQATEVVQVGEAALHDPPLATQTGAVRDAPAGDQRLDVAPAQEPAILVVVVTAVGQQAIRLAAGSATLASDGAGVQGVQQRHELGDVVAVAGGECDRQRDARGIDQQVVLRAWAGAIDRGWPRQEPPKRARTWEPSMAARDQSIAPAALRRTSRRWCNASQTPARCQSRSRRQQVTPEP